MSGILKMTAMTGLAILGSPPGLATTTQTFDRPDWINYMTPAAVDYTAEMVEENPTQRGRGHVFVYRSGSRQREEVTLSNGVVQIDYANLSTGISWNLIRKDKGTPVALSVSGPSKRHTATVEKTPAHDQLLGEICGVWILTRDGGAGMPPINSKECVTSDGILLWQKTYYHDGTVMSSARAVAIKRRSVKRNEVVIPADAVTLSSYSQWTPGLQSTPNDEVVLHGSPYYSQGPANSILIRRLGQLSMRGSTSSSRGMRTYTNAGYDLIVTQTPTGKLDRLDLVPRPPAPGEGRGVAMQPATYETILGIRCQDFDMAPGAADYSKTQCLTADGVLLSEISGGWGSTSGVTAIRLARNAVALTDVVPPSDILTGNLTGLRTLAGLNAVRPGDVIAAPPRPRYVSGNWLNLPSDASSRNVYPVQAWDDEVEGSVTLDCVLGGAGTIDTCSMVSENPKGYGFGASTIALMRAEARMEPGTFSAGDHTRLTYKWRLPAEGMPVSAAARPHVNSACTTASGSKDCLNAASVREVLKAKSEQAKSNAYTSPLKD